MGEVVDLPCITTLDIEPDKVLNGAVGELSTAIVIGYEHDGGEYFASSITNRAEILWLVERFKQMVLSAED